MKRKTMLLCLSLSCSLGIHSLAATSDFPYKNPKLSVEQRVSDLLGRERLAFTYDVGRKSRPVEYEKAEPAENRQKGKGDGRFLGFPFQW